ncbi:MAG: hypothetical protein JSV56_00150 [Methanomassiliicoccales archaeon]|nr:MAG: hypothetical protein JSV56_00150 [Methanomassiliicoccales archaeon]
MEPEELDKILLKIQKEYSGEIINDTILCASINGKDLFVKVINREDFCVFTTIISPKDDDYISDDWTKDISMYSKEIQNIQSLLPKKRIANLRVIATAGFKEDGMSEMFIKEYSAFFNKRINELGMVYNICILTKDDQIENPPFHMKDYVIASIAKDLDDSKRIISELLDDLAFLAVFEGKLERMYKAYVTFDKRIDGMEKRSVDMLKTTSDILKQDVSQKTLEELLIQISKQFSEISTMVATISHDISTVNSNIHNASTIYNKWNEIPHGSYPMVHITSLKDLDVIAYAYKSIGDKLEITRGRLNDTLGIIKTYLDLKQQKVSLKLQSSIEESSKSQESILKAAQEEKMASERSERSLKFLTYLFAGLGISEILANFIIFYIQGGNITTTFLYFSITLSIPLIIIALIIITIKRRSEREQTQNKKHT